MKNKKFKLIHFIILELGYEPDLIKCELTLERVNQTGFLRYVLFLYLFIGNILKRIKIFYKIYKKIILYKFLAGVVILVFESDTDFENTIQNSKNTHNYDSKVYDTIVVGSGPGGSVAALRLIENNEDVLIIESGGAYDPETIAHHSLAQTNLQFYKQGMNFCYGNVQCCLLKDQLMVEVVR